MEKITKEDAKQIFSAISVAEGEIGDEYGELKAKLYRLFPEIKLEHELRERQFKAEHDRQRDARREITEAFLKTVNPESSILEQVTAWYLANETEIRNHYSDEICFPFDLWQYATNLIPKLASECRTALANGTPYEQGYATASDTEIVHGLIRILERKLFEQRRKGLK